MIIFAENIPPDHKPSSKGSGPTESTPTILIVSIKRIPGKITGTKLINTIDIEKRKTIQLTYLVDIFNFFSLFVFSSELFTFFLDFFTNFVIY